MITAKRHGVTLLTLAPEQVSAGVISRLTAAGVQVALGHSMATYAQTIAAMAEGLVGFTHLFNAMRPLVSREPGPIAAALESAECLVQFDRGRSPCCSRHAAACVAWRRPSDFGDRRYAPRGRLAIVIYSQWRNDCRARRAVSAKRWHTSWRLSRHGNRRWQLRAFVGGPLTDALRYASTYPAEFLGLGDTFGRLAPGYRADMVAFDGATMAVLRTWVAGASSEQGRLGEHISAFVG